LAVGAAPEKWGDGRKEMEGIWATMRGLREAGNRRPLAVKDVDIEEEVLEEALEEEVEFGNGSLGSDSRSLGSGR